MKITQTEIKAIIHSKKAEIKELKDKAKQTESELVDKQNESFLNIASELKCYPTYVQNALDIDRKTVIEVSHLLRQEYTNLLPDPEDTIKSPSDMENEIILMAERFDTLQQICTVLSVTK